MRSSKRLEAWIWAGSFSLVVAVLIAAGCGGPGSSSPPSTQGGMFGTLTIQLPTSKSTKDPLVPLTINPFADTIKVQVVDPNSQQPVVPPVTLLATSQGFYTFYGVTNQIVTVNNVPVGLEEVIVQDLSSYLNNQVLDQGQATITVQPGNNQVNINMTPVD